MTWASRLDLKEESEDERKRVPDHKSDVFKGSLPQGLPAHPMNRDILQSILVSLVLECVVAAKCSTTDVHWKRRCV